ncbi:MAG TPA: lipoyl(octanoyl) transferase LipB [Terriglobales bacterium]|nr:lipoyl(octanoyl) transferase LipB [Terriglobales bacterium]
MISVFQLGILDYVTGLRLQQKLVQLRKDGRIGDVLLLLEHSPVITLGRNAKAANVIASAEQLAERSVEIFQCDRGGDVTFHGPGQIVGYPIFDLRGLASADGKRKTLGAVEYVRRLEEVLIRTCADFRISAERVAGLTGVWTTLDRVGTGLRPVRGELESPPERGLKVAPTGSQTRFHTSYGQSKIAAIGVHISRGVTSHGFALNVNIDLDYFNLIVPCGIASKPVTSMAKELGQQLPLQELAHAVSRNFGVVFQSQMLWLETLDSLLGHPVGVPMKPPAELQQLRNEEDTFWA